MLGSISSPARNLSFGASQAALSLLDEEQLFIQGILLKLQLLQKSRRRLQFLLQRKDGAVFRFDFIHLQGRQRNYSQEITHNERRVVLLMALGQLVKFTPRKKMQTRKLEKLI